MPLVPVAHCATIGEAEAARSALEAAGIETFIDNEHIVAIDWLMSQAVGRIKVLVREEELEQAEQILAELPSAAPIEGEPEYERPPIAAPLACPECGSGAVQRVPRLRLFALFAFVALAIGYAFGHFDFAMAGVFAAALIVLLVPSHQCRECTHRWNAEIREPDAPPPDARDLVEKTCPHCGSAEIVRLRYRKLKAVPLLWSFMILIVAPIYLVLPKWQCENCGRRS